MGKVRLKMLKSLILVFCLGIIISAGGCQMLEKSQKEQVELAVGFKKGVSQAEAEKVLSKYKLKFEKREHLSMGKVFFYETGEKFIVWVPKSQVKKWADKLNNEREIRMVGVHVEGRLID